MFYRVSQIFQERIEKCNQRIDALSRETSRPEGSHHWSGGIGFDVAEFVTSPHRHLPVPIDDFLAHWGIDKTHTSAGGMSTPTREAPDRHVTMLQRTDARPGKSLGLTTGWVVRGELKSRGVRNITGATYERIDDDGLHIIVGGEQKVTC